MSQEVTTPEVNEFEQLAAEATTLPAEAQGFVARLIKSIRNREATPAPAVIEKSEGDETEDEEVAKSESADESAETEETVEKSKKGKSIMADGKAIKADGKGIMADGKSMEDLGDNDTADDDTEAERDEDDEQLDAEEEDRPVKKRPPLGNKLEKAEDPNDDDMEASASGDEDEEEEEEEDEKDEDGECRKSLADEIEESGAPLEAFEAGPILKSISDRLEEVSASNDDLASTVEELGEVVKSIVGELEKSFSAKFRSLRKSLEGSMGEVFVKSLTEMEATLSKAVPAEVEVEAEPLEKSVNSTVEVPEVPAEPLQAEATPIATDSLESLNKSIAGNVDELAILEKALDGGAVATPAAPLEKALSMTDVLIGLRNASTSDPSINAATISAITPMSVDQVPAEIMQKALVGLGRVKA